MNYGLPNEHHPAEGIICSGLPPKGSFQQLADDGVGVVVNLRSIEEDPTRSLKEEVEETGMRYINIPISGGVDFSKDNAQRLDKAVKSAAEKGEKIYVFCGGSNRVGGLFALKSYLFDGMSKEEAIAFGKAAGLTSLLPTVISILDQIDG